MKSTSLILLSFASLCLLFSVLAVADEAEQDVSVAIVVHADTVVDDLSLPQLRRIFLAEQQFWGDDSRITLLVRAPGAYERDLVMNLLYRMDEAQFRKYWIAKMFRAEVPSGPKIVFSNNMALELVKAIPGSITFLNAADIDDSVKVVTIDGLSPEDQGYPLR
jgi:ABC-type phosphate transport system substrate-binding protein